MGRVVTRKSSAGFTLIEIIIAVTLLAVGLVTLIGVYSSATSRTVRDYWAFKGTLLARQILTEYEAGLKEFEIGSEEIDVKDYLDDEGDDPDQSESDLINQMKARVEVRWAELPMLEPESIKEIRATVAWGEEPTDQVALSYFVLKDDDELTANPAGATGTPAPTTPGSGGPGSGGLGSGAPSGSQITTSGGSRGIGGGPRQGGSSSSVIAGRREDG